MMTALPLVLLLSLPAGALTPGVATLCVRARANLAIIVSANASTRVKATAELWPTNFSEITGSEFKLADGDGRADWRWDVGGVSRLSALDAGINRAGPRPARTAPPAFA